MKCSGCGNEARVTDSRPTQLYGVECIRRRRICKHCKARVTTYELTPEQIASMKSEAMQIAAKGAIEDAVSRIGVEISNALMVEYSTRKRA